MDEFKVIEIKKSVFENNDREADRIRERLKKEHTFLLNLMSSPGSGKTTTLKATISRLKDEMKIGVMEADIDSSVDAKAIAETGVKSIQLHTLGMCHLDAGMTEQGIDEFGTDELDLVVLENVGNLVCPAELFSICDVVLINKIDAKSVFDFDDDAVVERIKKLNPKAEIFFISAKTGEGVDAWCDWLRKQVKAWCK